MIEKSTSAKMPSRDIMNYVFPALMITMTITAFLRQQPPPWHEGIWLAVYWMQAIIRVPHVKRNAANVIVSDKRDLNEKIALAAMFLTMGALPIIEVGTNIFAFADYALPLSAGVIGTLLQLPFLWLFWRSHSDLGRNWSTTLETREGHELVTHGIYASIRHPMYAAIWCAVIGQPLLVQNWIAGVPIIAAFTFMWFVRIPREEAMMRAQFGEAYDAYCAQTGRIWPKPGKANLSPSRIDMPDKEELRRQTSRDEA
jgi:protein-S-isoprenylcysteine O-methyltransferase Ste14